VSDAPPIDVRSDTWRALQAWAARELHDARTALEQPALDQPATEFQRGRIQTLRAVLELPLDRPKAPTTAGYA